MPAISLQVQRSRGRPAAALYPQNLRPPISLPLPNLNLETRPRPHFHCRRIETNKFRVVPHGDANCSSRRGFSLDIFNFAA